MVKIDQNEIREQGAGEEVAPIGRLEEMGNHREEVTFGHGREVSPAPLVSVQ